MRCARWPIGSSVSPTAASRRLGPALDGAVGAPGSATLPRLGSEERVAGPALASDDRFQEEREWWPRDLHERPQRRVAVQHHLAQHGDHPAPLGARQEIGAVFASFGRGGVHRAWTVARGQAGCQSLAGCASRSPRTAVRGSPPPSPSACSSGPRRGADVELGCRPRAGPPRGAAPRGAVADSSLHDYKAQAHGFLFFLGAFGQGLADPPRLVKADQLELEVYWKARRAASSASSGGATRPSFPPTSTTIATTSASSRTISAWRCAWAKGMRCANVPHPLSPAGPDIYDFALDDTTTIMLPSASAGGHPAGASQGFRPPRIVGTLYLDAETADLVRMAFNSPRTPTRPRARGRERRARQRVVGATLLASYRQEIEIRRRATWLDVPVRASSAPAGRSTATCSTLAREELVRRRRDHVPAKAERDSFPWKEPLGAALQDIAEPVRQNDLERVRAEVEQIAGRRVSPVSRGVGSACGACRPAACESGGRARAGAGVWCAAGASGASCAPRELRLGDQRAKGALSAVIAGGGALSTISVYREVRDVGGRRRHRAALNSSHLRIRPATTETTTWRRADAYLPHGIGVRTEWRRPRPGVDRLSRGGGGARQRRVPPNVPLGGGGVDLVQLALERQERGFAVGATARRDARRGGRRDGGATSCGSPRRGSRVCSPWALDAAARRARVDRQPRPPRHRRVRAGRAWDAARREFPALGRWARGLLHLECACRCRRVAWPRAYARTPRLSRSRRTSPCWAAAP